MTYNFITNTKCLEGCKRYKWAKLGRTSASQCSVAIDELGRLFTWGPNPYQQTGQGDPHYISYHNYERPELMEIELATQLTHFSDFVKSCSGEGASMALRSNGELWGWGVAIGTDPENCASFGLPHDSGDCRTTWSGTPCPNDEVIFYSPVRCTPGYLWKDFSFDYYHATAIGMDDKLYTWGKDYGDGALGLGPGIDTIRTPTLNPTLTADIKLLDSELLCSSAVTVDDRVYVWGDWWAPWGTYYVPTEITGLVIPSGETVVGLSSDSWLGVMVVLSNGELWAAGRDFLFGDQGVTGDSLTFKQVTCFANPIVLAKITSLGSSAVVVIDDQGDIYGWSNGEDEFVGTSVNPSPDWELPNLIAAQFPGERNYIDVILNTHNSTFQAIDDQGYLWTWGGQWWGPHLAIGARSTASTGTYDPYIDPDYRVNLRSIAGYAEDAVLINGDPALLNVFPLGESDYIQPLPQMLRHRPCGHWHLREFDKDDLWPRNCWMPSVSIYQNNLMFVACGKHLKTGIDTGLEVIIFDYDMDANEWIVAMYDDLINAANAPGGASYYDDTMAFANHKADGTGTGWYDENYTNFCLGVWVLDRNNYTDSYIISERGYDMNYTEFAMPVRYMQGKVAAYSGGVVAVAYEDAAGQLLVQVTTDYGATWNLRKTVGVDTDRKDWSICCDKNGYFYLVHQITATSVMVERTIDNGLNWTTRYASNYLIANLIELKVVADNDMLFLFGNSATASAIERSSNGGTSFSTMMYEPLASSHVSSGCDVDDGDDGYSFMTAGEDFNNFTYDADYGASTWLERTIPQITEEGEEINTYPGPSLSDLNGYNGRFAFSSYNFYSIPVPYVAVALSVDLGVTWVVRSTPLGWADSAELGNFLGCPLFCLTDVPHLNHIWTFEKSDWNTTFVKQKDKYKVERPCVCPLGNRCE